MRIRRSLPGNKIAKPTDQLISCRLLRSRQEITYPFGLPFCSLAASLLNYRTKAMRIRRSLPGNKIAKPTDQLISCRLLSNFGVTAAWIAKFRGLASKQILTGSILAIYLGLAASGLSAARPMPPDGIDRTGFHQNPITAIYQECFELWMLTEFCQVAIDHDRHALLTP